MCKVSIYLMLVIQAQHLLCLKNIRSVVFAENPCVCLEGRTFCYRPYLYCCCLEQLQIVDGKELSETEIIKGWIEILFFFFCNMRYIFIRCMAVRKIEMQ